MIRRLLFILFAIGTTGFGQSTADLRDPLGAERRGDVWVMPKPVQNLRVLEDGTWVIATSKDPKERSGLREGVRWISAESLPAEADVEPVPVHIDRRGHAWYRPLETNRRSFWLVADGTNLVQHTTDLRFVGPPRETRSGDLWVAAHDVLPQPATTNRVVELLRIPGDGKPERFDDLSLTLSGNDVLETPRGDVVWWHSGLHQQADPADPENAAELRTAVWMRDSGFFTASFGMPVVTDQLHIGLDGTWRASRTKPPSVHAVRFGSTPLPDNVRQTVKRLGAVKHKERQAAETELRKQFGKWRKGLQKLAEKERDPEVRARLETVLEAASAESANAKNSEEEEEGTALPVSSRLVMPRVLNTDMLVVAVAEASPDWLAPPGRWHVFGIGENGEVVSIASNLPPTWAPSPGLPNEQVAAFDMARLDERTWVWRDAQGSPCIWRDGARLELKGVRGLNPSFPLAQCRILSTWKDGFAFRMHREVVVVEREALDKATRRQPEPNEPFDEETKRKLKPFIEGYRTFYDTDMTSEELCELADSAMALAPDFWLGDYVRGTFRAGGDERKRLTLESVERALGQQRNRELVTTRAEAWASLENHTEQIRDLNFMIELQGLEAPALDSLYLQRGNVYLNAEKWEHCLQDFEVSLRYDPHNQVSRNNIAWVLATAADPKVRDGKKAVELALKVCTFQDFEEDYSLDTLAAAYAETGDFAKAIDTQEKAIALIDEDDSRWREFQSHLKDFKNKKPIRLPEPPLVEPKDETPPEPEGL